jgi:hypothetical protein
LDFFFAGVPVLVQTPPEQLPLPSIRLASALPEKTGAGTEREKIAKAKAATIGTNHFILCFLFKRIEP